ALPHLRHREALPRQPDRRAGRGWPGGGGGRPRGRGLRGHPHPPPVAPVTLRAAVLSTGDELTTGRIVDTNASWIADKLFEIGVELAGVLTVGDHHDRLVWAWRRALELADVVISTGGIGPTADDLTSEVVAEVAGVPLVEDAEQAARIRQLFGALGRDRSLRGTRVVPRELPGGLGARRGARAAGRGGGASRGARGTHPRPHRSLRLRRGRRHDGRGGGPPPPRAPPHGRARRVVHRRPRRSPAHQRSGQLG